MASNNAINLQFPVAVSKGGLGVASLTAKRVLLGNGTDPVAVSDALTDGKLLIGSTADGPQAAELTEGAGITVTSGSGSIEIAANLEAGAGVSVTENAGAYVLAANLEEGDGITITENAGAYVIASTAAPMTWSVVSGNAQTMAVNNAYVAANNAARVVFTLPTSAALGERMEVRYKGTQGWRVNKNQGQSVVFGEFSADYLQSTQSGDALLIECIDATSGAEVFQAFALSGNPQYTD
jgi:hypothetical protein